MNSRNWFVALIVCLAPLPRATADDKKPDTKPKGIDKATAEAWAKRGFKTGWQRENQSAVWLSSEYPKAGGAIPAFWHGDFGRGLTDAALKDLPQVDVPFALHLAGRTQITDAGLEHLAALKQLVRLSLQGAQVTGEGLKHLARLEHLTSLKLPRGLTDKDVKHLVALKGLTALTLGGSPLTDAGLKELTALNKLTVLDLSSTRVTDDGLEHLAALGDLTQLGLHTTAVTGRRLKPLLGLKKLTWLGLDAEKVTDDVLRTLSEAGLLHALHQAEYRGGPDGYTEDGRRPAGPEEARTFNLLFTRVTDDGVKHLAALTNLTNLYFGARQATPAGIKHVAKFKTLAVVYIDSVDVTAEILKPLAELKSLTHLTVPITDETLKALHEAGLLHRLRQAKGADGKRPAGPDEVISFDLSEKRLKGEGLKYVAKLKNLASLNLRRTEVAEEWVEDLRRTLPKCKIER